MSPEIGVGSAPGRPISREHGVRALVPVLAAWFGVRGIGSLYYLSQAASFGVDPAIAARLVSLTLWSIVVSVVVYGVSATPLMRR